MTTCVVFVCNKKYFHAFMKTCNQLFTYGKYDGDVCLVIGNDLVNDDLLKCDFIIKNKIIIKYFPDITFSNEFLEINRSINATCNLTKPFQWHKLHLFQTYFKLWDYIFYIDCGMTIFSDITPMLNEVTENTLLAHSDAYPTYEWKLHRQFCNRNKQLYDNLCSTYDLNIDYFQTGIMLYHTNIITNDTFTDLLQLSMKYPISKTNEQGIIALYFTNIKPLFKQIKTNNNETYFYDCLSRNTNNKYIMLKMC